MAYRAYRIPAVVLVAIGAIQFQIVRQQLSDTVVTQALPVSWTPFDQANVILKNELKYCEDALFDHEMGIAILSCDPGRAEWNTVMDTMYDPRPKGALYLYDYVSQRNLRKITLDGLPADFDFHPLGINFYREEGGSTRLFVVNHQRHGSTIDVFDLYYDDSKAIFLSSISDGDNHILSPNAIAPISYTSFYVTNDHRFIPRLRSVLNKAETFGGLPLSWVTLVDFANSPKFITAARNIGFANGIVLTPTGKEVIIAGTINGALFVYDRDRDTNNLTYRKKISVPFHPDNLAFDESLSRHDPTAFDQDGRFLRGLSATGHPAVFTLFAVSRDPVNKTAPSWVVEVRRGSGDVDTAPHPVTPDEKSDYYLRTLFQSNGSFFSSSSSGPVDFKRGRMIVSGLYAKGILEVTWDGQA